MLHKKYVNNISTPLLLLNLWQYFHMILFIIIWQIWIFWIFFNTNISYIIYKKINFCILWHIFFYFVVYLCISIVEGDGWIFNFLPFCKWIVECKWNDMSCTCMLMGLLLKEYFIAYSFKILQKKNSNFFKFL